MNKKIAKGSIFLWASALVMGGIGASSLFTQLNTFNQMVAQYVSQGYKEAEVLAQLVPNQLLPALYNTVSVNLGFTLALIGMALLYQKLHNQNLPALEVVEAPENQAVVTAPTLDEMMPEVAEATPETEVESVESAETNK